MSKFSKFELEVKYLDACLSGDMDTVSFMVKCENKKLKNPEFMIKCLNKTCEGGHMEIFKIILDYRDTIHNKQNSVLCRVCETGRVDFFELYYNKINGDSLLFEFHKFVYGAYESGNVDMVKYILSKFKNVLKMTFVDMNICLERHVRQET